MPSHFMSVFPSDSRQCWTLLTGRAAHLSNEKGCTPRLYAPPFFAEFQDLMKKRAQLLKSGGASKGTRAHWKGRLAVLSNIG